MNESESARPIRICLAVRPELARTLLRDMFARHRDIEVVDAPSGDWSTHAALDTCDVIVTQPSRATMSDQIPLHGLLKRSTRNTLVVTIDGALVMMFECRPRQGLIDPAPDALVAAIRSGVAAMTRGER